MTWTSQHMSGGPHRTLIPACVLLDCTAMSGGCHTGEVVRVMVGEPGFQAWLTVWGGHGLSSLRWW